MATLTKEDEKVLSDVYYGSKAYFGRDRLWSLVRGKGISRRQVANWLSKQEVHQLFAPAHKPKVVRPSLPSGPRDQVGIDLVDMRSLPSGPYDWILTAIDLFTKEAYAVPMQGKTAGEAVRAARKLFDEIEPKPRRVRSDNGSEFISAQFKRMMAQRGIRHVFSLPGKPWSNGAVERFNATLKRLIKMWMLQTGGSDWHTVLDDMLNSYNSSTQRVTKRIPYEVPYLDEDDRREVYDSIREAGMRLGDSAAPLAKGQQVRIRLDWGDAEKRGEAWSRDTFTVRSVSKPKTEVTPVTYRVSDDKGVPLGTVFYRADLQPISPPERHVESERLWEVSRIDNPRKVRGETYYEVWWKGFDRPTLEPRSVLIVDVPKVVKAFEKRA